MIQQQLKSRCDYERERKPANEPTQYVMYNNKIYNITKSCLESISSGERIDRNKINNKDIKFLLNDPTYKLFTTYYNDDDDPLSYYGKIQGSNQFVFTNSRSDIIILNRGDVSLQPTSRCENSAQQIQRQAVNSPLIYYLRSLPGFWNLKIYRVTAKCLISLNPSQKEMLKKSAFFDYDRNREIIRDSSQSQYILDQEYVRDHVTKKYYGYLFMSPNSSNFTKQGSTNSIIANIFADANGQNVDIVKPTDIQYAPPKTKSFCILL